MTKITSDWHIHSRNSCDSAALTIADIIAGTQKAGIIDFGITDHVHTPYNLPDLEASRAEYLSVNPTAHFHFGVEATCVSKWEIEEIVSGRYKTRLYENHSWACPRTGIRRGWHPGCELAMGLPCEYIDRLKIEYVLGGAHWPMFVPMDRRAIINDFHRQNMFMVCNDMVNIVAHPWFFGGSYWANEDAQYRTNPWFDDFAKAIPRSMHDEFAAAAVENNKLVEINIPMLINPKHSERFVAQYLDYFAGLRDRGVGLTIGSDCHNDRYEIDFPLIGRMLGKVNIGEKDLHTPMLRRF